MKRLLATTLVVVGALAANAAAQPQPNAYLVHNLSSNIPGLADNTNPDVVNAWGLDASATSPWWVADNATDLSSVLTASGAALALRPTVPGGPTGLVANRTTSSFAVGGVRASFLFSGEDGVIRGWSGATGVQVGADRSGAGAIYKGLAIAANPDRLYAADFHNARIDVFDGSFHLVNVPGAFTDPALPSDFAPFGVQNVGGMIVVTYAKQDEEQEDEVQGQGLGFVDAYDTAGNILARIATRGQLNAPWGIAKAPADFGRFSGDLLIGNFGDGEITAFAQDEDGEWGPRGQLRGTDHSPIAIDGLWALQFGHGAANNGPTNTLFFTAGPNDEEDGLFGRITAG